MPVRAASWSRSYSRRASPGATATRAVVRGARGGQVALVVDGGQADVAPGDGVGRVERHGVPPQRQGVRAAIRRRRSSGPAGTGRGRRRVGVGRLAEQRRVGEPAGEAPGRVDGAGPGAFGRGIGGAAREPQHVRAVVGQQRADGGLPRRRVALRPSALGQAREGGLVLPGAGEARSRRRAGSGRRRSRAARPGADSQASSGSSRGRRPAPLAAAVLPRPAVAHHGQRERLQVLRLGAADVGEPGQGLFVSGRRARRGGPSGSRPAPARRATRRPARKAS